MSGTIQLLGLAATAFGLIGSVAATAAQPHVLCATAGWAPASRHRALRLLGMAPLIGTAVALLSVLTPSLLALAWPAFDHCFAHDDGHAHLCLIHGAGAHGGLAVWLILAAAVTWVGAGLAHEARRLIDGRALVRRLLSTARYDPTRGAWIVATDQLLCVSVGLLRPRVVLSQGLLDRASEPELAVMGAHEDAHRTRRDALWRLVVRVSGVLLPVRARETLLSALQLASERACDEQAAAAVGDRLCVAETLLAMEKRLAAPHSALITAFGSSSVPERVEALLEAPPSGGAGRGLTFLALGTALLLLAAHDGLHHATESALAHLFH
jgi:hypothetical protein